MKYIVSNNQNNLSIKNKAFPYQVEAFNALKDLEYAAIFHEQGLGKTKIAIDLIIYWLKNKDIDTVMIVTKKQLIKNWFEEFRFHTYIVPKVLSNNKQDNFYVLNSPVKVIVTNFETILSDRTRICLFLKSRNVGIIIDESAKLKNPNTKLAQTFFELSDLFKRKIIMTGTPIANRPYDIWAQIYFLDKGQSLGTNFEEFKRKTNLTNTLNHDSSARSKFEQSVAEINQLIAPFCVRETKKSCALNLPNKVYKSVFADFAIEQKKMYQKVLYTMKVEIEQKGNHIFDDDRVALKRLIRLLQITSCPRLIDDNYQELSGKEVVLKNIIEKIMDRNEKCIVWSSFIKNIEYLASKYECYCPRKIHGQMQLSERNFSVDIFKRDSNCRILFATPQAAKEGLTLTVANNVIFYDRGFNLDDYLQAQDRIHRISQTKICYIYNIMIRNSIDIWIQELLNAKQQAAFLGQGDIALDEYKQVADYNYCDIIKDILKAGQENDN
ncbi:DEAD/DEAH box helicase [Megasphaera elsdenii]|uniref:DEAD/DEAH box helicase n=1 Tax=Megasphaera elsdenii TaxID=907 RepID=UPI0005129D66|nr:DEAD/DEAH box helicase [Megasphaera elsdenii]KGI89464.1 helicase [Megasphaera elsdenii]SHK31458.1 Helicase conserved C-terminal domain-containing protein [Megasphaera elsdenii]